MKKILCLLLSMICIFAFTGCRSILSPGNSSIQTTQSEIQTTFPSTETPTQPTENTIPWVPQEQTAISLPAVYDAVTASDGTVIFRHTYQEVVLSTPDAYVAETVAMDLLRRIDTNADALNVLLHLAQSSYPGNPDNWQPHYLEVLYTPTRLDSYILSLHGTESSFSGAGNPTSASVSVNYNLASGEVLTLGDILAEAKTAADDLCRLILDELAKQEAQLFDDYADVIVRRFQSDLDQESTWYFSDEGLCLFYHPYDIAPHASGTIYITLPYGQLSGVIDDSFFPAYPPKLPGNLEASWFAETDLNQFSYFSELILDSGCAPAIFYTDGNLFNLHLQEGHWDSALNQFVPTSTVYAANTLNQGDAFVLHAPISDTTPTLLLHYEANGESYSAYILRDIATGKLLLHYTK